MRASAAVSATHALAAAASDAPARGKDDRCGEQTPARQPACPGISRSGRSPSPATAPRWRSSPPSGARSRRRRRARASLSQRSCGVSTRPAQTRPCRLRARFACTPSQRSDDARLACPERFPPVLRPLLTPARPRAFGKKACRRRRLDHAPRLPERARGAKPDLRQGLGAADGRDGERKADRLSGEVDLA